ncbi:MAG: hypothetical protein EU547_04035 [Promethearchaeota archaeon]|nr:MAG: hypothetical protein EU547_04035 [Candidatus Lokiarchaeota archaeon]
MSNETKNYPGILILFVGNSGSGKDSIISGVTKKYPPNLKQPLVVKRFITRPSSGYEDNYSITEETFKKMNKQGKFALTWYIYNLFYGIPIEIDNWLKKGNPVIVNVSRTVIHEAQKKYKNCKVIFVKVPFEITRKRIRERGREDGKILKKRIERARTHQSFPHADYVVDNSDNLKDAISQALEYIIRCVQCSR